MTTFHKLSNFVTDIAPIAIFAILYLIGYCAIWFALRSIIGMGFALYTLDVGQFLVAEALFVNSALILFLIVRLSSRS